MWCILIEFRFLKKLILIKQVHRKKLIFSTINFIEDGPFGAAHGWKKGAKKVPLQ